MDVRGKALTLIAPLFAILVCVGCSVGEVPTGGGGVGPDASMNNTDASNSSDPGETSFNATIKPIVASCVGCHQGAQPPNVTSFTALEAKYKMKPGNTNIFVTKGPHTGTNYFNPTDKAAVEKWINDL